MSRTPVHPRTPRRAPWVLAALAVLAVALMVASGCGSSSSSSDAGSGSTSTTAASGAGPEKLVIAYQLIPNGDLVVKNQKWLEEALPGTTIEWKQFDSGGSVNEAFAAGSVDIGLVGSSPASRGLSQGLAYQVPWIHDVIGNAEALVAKSGISTIADLKGKKVAVPLASTTHYSLLAALRDAGIDPADVNIIDSEPADIQAAWSRGDIDAAYIWNPTLAALVKDGGTVITDSAEQAKKGHITYDLAVASNDLASKYPDLLNAWASAQNRAVALYSSNPNEWAKAVGAELNLTPAEVLDQAKGLQFLPASEQVGPDYLGGGLGEDLYSTATFNKDVGEITSVKKQSDYTAAVNPAFAQAAADAAGK